MPKILAVDFDNTLFHQIMSQEAPASISGERNAADNIPFPDVFWIDTRLAIMII